MNKNKINSLTWRKMIPFFAAFFCVGLVATSCKKEINPLGQDLLSPDDIMYSGGIDTFKIVTYTELEDSVPTINPEFNLIGSYLDSYYGVVSADFYTQLLLSGFSPDFGDLNTLVIDSAVMTFEYGGYYGNLYPMQFEIYELTEDLEEKGEYFSNSTVNVGLQNLVPTGTGLITPNLSSKVVVGSDTVAAHLRIPVENLFAKHLLEIAETSTTNAEFQEQFKGFYFTVNDPNPSANGGILYLASSRKGSKLTVYYTQDGEQDQFDFTITNKAVDFNHFVVETAGSKVEDLLNSPENGQIEFYSQAFTSRAKIEFPTINELPDNIIIHKATLELPINYFEGDKFYMSNEVIASAKLFENDDNKYVVSSITYDKARKAYIIDLRSYIQNIKRGEIINNGLYISPKRFNTSAERIIFNGAESGNKKQPKLNVVYTEL